METIKTANDFLKGWRTHILMLIVFLSGLLDAFGAIDLKEFFVGMGVPADKVPFAMITFSMVGITLRQMAASGKKTS